MAFLTITGLIVYAAHRLNAVFALSEKASVEAYKHLIEHVHDAVMRFDAGGSPSFVSRSVEELFGCRRYELAGSGLTDRIHVMDKPTYLTALADARASGEPRQVEIRMRRDGDTAATTPYFIWVEVAMSPIADGDTARGEVMVMLRDVTPQRDHEIELQRARKAAEEESLAKSRLLATIGHELRTPLNAIVGFSEMMTSGLSGDLSPQHREYATLIRQSGQHLIEMAKMLLDMSRLEADKFELQIEPFLPDTLVESCFRMVDAMAGAKAIRLLSDIPRALPMLVADEGACRQILINLLSNAIKFSREGAVVTIAMRRQGRFLVMSVTDSGIGMGEEEVRRLGEPYFQAGPARRNGGAGLGLSIVKGLVELHGGELHADSSPGEGTVMTVLLPINGPETKVGETASITPLYREPAQQQMPTWPADERKRAL